MKYLKYAMSLGMLFAITGQSLMAQAQPQMLQNNRFSGPPQGCPPGFTQAVHPLNPQLGCLPTNLQAQPSQQTQSHSVLFKPSRIQAPPHGCPPGFKQAVHPLNPQLGCLPTNMQMTPN